MEKEKLVALVSAAQNGDADAKSELFTAFYDDVYYFALKTVKDDDLAGDITQETFIEILNSLEKLEEPAAFVTWMKQIAFHQCTRYFRKKKDVIVDEDEDGGTIFDNLKEESAEFIPEEALDNDELKKTLLGMLDELSEEQRSAVILHYFNNMSVKDIATIQGVSEGTVKSRLNYARKALKKSAEDYHKKNGIPLGAFSMFGLIRWLMADGAGSALSAVKAAALAEGVSAATGVSVSAAASAGAAASAATAAGAAAGTVTTVTTATATAAASGITAKIVAGIVAAAIVIGGTTTAVILSNKDDSSAPTHSVVDKDPLNDSGAVTIAPLLLKPDLSADEATELFTHALNYYLGQTGHDFPTFSDASELSADDMVIFASPLMARRADNTISTEGLKRTVYNIFGRELDLDSLTEASVTKSGEDYMFTKTPGTAYASVYSATIVEKTENPNRHRTLFEKKDTNELIPMQLDKVEAYWHITLFGSTRDQTTLDGQDEPAAEHSYSVPEGATYVSVSGETYRAGDVITTTPQSGDKLITADYTYMNGGMYEYYPANEYDPVQDRGWFMNETYAGIWTPRVNDMTKTSYEPILSEINGAPVGSVVHTFAGCSNMLYSPKIPDTVIYSGWTYAQCASLKEAPVLPPNLKWATNTFFGCTSLTKAPVLPKSLFDLTQTFRGCTGITSAPELHEGITEMYGAFEGCTSLTKAPVIPSTVTWMNVAFKGCTALTGEVVIHANPAPDEDGSNLDSCFEETVLPIVLSGNSDYLDELAATANNGNVTVAK